MKREELLAVWKRGSKRSRQSSGRDQRRGWFTRSSASFRSP